MRAKEVLELLDITRPTLCKYVSLEDVHTFLANGWTMSDPSYRKYESYCNETE